MFWSGGKDSALALDRVLRDGRYEVTSLITTINPEFGRVSMHGVREALIVAQAAAAGLSLLPMYVGSSSSNEAYVESLRAVLDEQRAQQVDVMIFGDIFLADLRAWRESLLAEVGMAGVFPLWGSDTHTLGYEFVERGFKGLICCADDAHLTEEVLGRELDEQFFQSLPGHVDPCGENGEYHSFVYDGPVFRDPVRFRRSERIYRPLFPDAARPLGTDDLDTRFTLPSAPAGTTTRGFWFLELLPDFDDDDS